MKLVNHLPAKYHKVYFDNFFIHFSDGNIEAEKILAYGTIRSSRKDFPALQDDKSLKRGQFDSRSTVDDIAVYKWKDSKAAIMLIH